MVPQIRTEGASWGASSGEKEKKGRGKEKKKEGGKKDPHVPMDYRSPEEMHGRGISLCEWDGGGNYLCRKDSRNFD